MSDNVSLTSQVGATHSTTVDSVQTQESDNTMAIVEWELVDSEDESDGEPIAKSLVQDMDLPVAVITLSNGSRFDCIVKKHTPVPSELSTDNRILWERVTTQMNTYEDTLARIGNVCQVVPLADKNTIAVLTCKWLVTPEGMRCGVDCWRAFADLKTRGKGIVAGIVISDVTEVGEDGEKETLLKGLELVVTHQALKSLPTEVVERVAKPKRQA